MILAHRVPARCARGALGLLLATCLAAPAAAEPVVSVYSGWQSALSSHVSGHDTDGTRLGFDADWEGRSWSAPPYYGVRYADFWSARWGWALDFTHVKVYADDATLERSGFSRLELTNGVNVLTVGPVRRFPTDGRLTPYLAGGVGFTYPHVETRSPASERSTYEYQFGGPAIALRAGVDWRLSERWSVFAEYDANYLPLDLDMAGGGRLKTDLFTQAANFGISFALGPRATR